METSHSPMSVAVVKADKTWLKVGAEWQRASEEIMPLIESTLRDAALTPSDLDAIALSIGPGSFTALRIGLSTAKGLCFALERPLITVGTLEALAHAAIDTLHRQQRCAQRLVPLVYSKADEFFVGEVETSLLRENVLAEIPKSYLTLAEIERRFPKGTGAVVYGRSPEKWRQRLLTMLDWVEADFSAQSLLVIAREKWQQRLLTDLASAEPLYLKDFEARVSTKKFFG
ncbi:MAG: tRNA (adenosine(37)-N6)-threonylcarbamoyltransferase complex dimerization subunit type 1 TsaB [Chloroherpetonaceae bacterium]|nr:tRNA (adenosine(37)-N6)-threonylcarbamoyltransferase complex dimerization subunit type 1 TsaB [Chloroherpetonaceae bacterium]